MDEGAQILELARNTQQLFERQEPRQKRHSTLYYRTALGKTAKSLPPSANHLICWAETTAIAARSAVSKIPNFDQKQGLAPLPGYVSNYVSRSRSAV
jgi:hypothetical protein